MRTAHTKSSTASRAEIGAVLCRVGGMARTALRFRLCWFAAECCERSAPGPTICSSVSPSAIHLPTTEDLVAEFVVERVAVVQSGGLASRSRRRFARTNTSGRARPPEGVEETAT